MGNKDKTTTKTFLEIEEFSSPSNSKKNQKEIELNYCSWSEYVNRSVFQIKISDASSKKFDVELMFLSYFNDKLLIDEAILRVETLLNNKLYSKAKAKFTNLAVKDFRPTDEGYTVMLGFENYEVLNK